MSNDNVIGLNKNMRDDNEYQYLFDKIKTRPEVKTGQILFNGMKIGFVYMPGCSSKNNERVYEVAANLPQSKNKPIAEGQAYTRRGSTNNLMTVDERNEIYLDRLRKGQAANSNILYQITALKQKTSDDYRNTSKY